MTEMKLMSAMIKIPLLYSYYFYFKLTPVFGYLYYSAGVNVISRTDPTHAMYVSFLPFFFIEMKGKQN